MKKNNIRIIALNIIVVALFAIMGQSCVSQQVSEKSGVQLWGENCTRCHDAPSPSEYNRGRWAVIGKHMQVRANLTKNETDKIIEYLSN